MPDKNWQFELEEYIKQGEPDSAEKSEAWQTAIGRFYIMLKMISYRNS